MEHPHSATLSDIQSMHIPNSYDRQFIHVLVGADLVIPDFLRLPGINAPLRADQLVAIPQYRAHAGVPLAVGQMVLSGGEAPAWGEREGWEGKKGCPGEGLPVGDGCRRGGVGVAKCPQGNGAAAGGRSMPMVGMGKGRKKWPMRWDSSRRCRLKVTTTLRAMLLYSIATNCLNAWPITATIFYTTHILPFQPAGPSEATTPIDIKNSLHKSPTTFLKAAEK
ncbi:hypothetical protein FIBSPDRAFT_1054586 [Athelia psychrophila]|uniref:eIF2D winged helix domain-containing protein n=1 Tax=Athelia psychrophila TaxID=1759441 RepID=A0A167V2R4_9AGAM|nr:hypothetical protein FIBSPDRAFT_1054586 [Fibularhizoctonia sp. CBS 109695]